MEESRSSALPVCVALNQLAAYGASRVYRARTDAYLYIWKGAFAITTLGVSPSLAHHRLVTRIITHPFIYILYSVYIYICIPWTYVHMQYCFEQTLNTTKTHTVW